MRKKIISMFLAISMLTSMQVPILAAEHVDVDEDTATEIYADDNLSAKESEPANKLENSLQPKETTWGLSEGDTVSAFKQRMKGFSVSTFNAQDLTSSNIIDVSAMEDFQSEHPYGNSMDTTWVYTHPEAADSVSVTFSADTSLESGCDHIYLYDAADTLIGQYTATELAGQTVTTDGNVMKVRLTTDGSVTYYGFSVTNIEAVLATGPITTAKVKSRAKNSVVLSFSQPRDAVSVTVEQSSDGENWSEATTEATVGSDSSTATVTGLELSTSYYFRLNVVGGVREGLSNVVTAKTMGDYTSEYDFEFSDGTITGYTGTDEDVVIPPEINGVKVKSIGYRAFDGNKNISSLILPSTLESIGSYAFRNCTYLSNISFNDGLLTIDSGAFQECSLLTDIVLPNTVTTMSNNIFSGCTRLKKVEFAEGTVKIPAYSLQGCESVESVIIPDSVNEIGEYAFSNCDAIKNITLPKALTYIPDYCFYDCDNLQVINIPESVTAINRYAFVSCDNLLAVNIGKSVETIGYRAFESCSEIVQLNIPESVKTIGSYAFLNCYGIQEITLPEGLNTIEGNAFYGCTRLQEITIPASVAVMGHGF